MSFDVEFRAASQTTAQEQSKEIREFLLQRPNYRENGEGLIYARESTGVYGLWEFPAIDQPQPSKDAPIAVLAINYLRPGFFSTELSREVGQLQRTFRLTIHDPQSGQNHGPADGASAIVNSYMNHAGLAARAFASDPEGSRPLTLPRHRLDEIWRWNDKLELLQRNLGHGVFVPTIMLATTASGLVSAVVWADGIPVLMPKVDVVLAFREHTAPKQGLLGRRIPVVEALAHTDFSARFQPFLAPFTDWPDTGLYGQDDPDGLKRLAAKQPIGTALRFADSAWRKQTKLISIDTVMDAEFLLGPQKPASLP